MAKSKTIVNTEIGVFRKSCKIKISVAGYGLVEIFISLFLATLLISGLITQYLQIKNGFIMAKKNMEREIELQYTTNLIRKSIHRSGFTPCGPLSSINNNLKSIEILPNKLITRSMAYNFSLIKNLISQNELSLFAPIRIKKLHKLLIADCYHAEIKVVQDVTNNNSKLILNSPLQFKYLPPIYAGEYIEETYYTKLNNQNIPALYYRNHHSEELNSNIIEINSVKKKDIVEILLTLDNYKKRL